MIVTVAEVVDALTIAPSEDHPVHLEVVVAAVTSAVAVAMLVPTPLVMTSEAAKAEETTIDLTVLAATAEDNDIDSSNYN